MTQQVQNHRWLNNPERRVGQQQLLRAILAGIGENDPRYRELRARLDAEMDRPGARSGGF